MAADPFASRLRSQREFRRLVEMSIRRPRVTLALQTDLTMRRFIADESEIDTGWVLTIMALIRNESKEMA
jgi:hypothetical protein